MSLLWQEGHVRCPTGTWHICPVFSVLSFFFCIINTLPFLSLLPGLFWSKNLHPTSQKQNEYSRGSLTIRHVLFPTDVFLNFLLCFMSVWVISEPQIGEDWVSLGFLSSAPRERSIVGNCLWDSLIVGTNEKKKEKRKLSSLKAISKILDNDSRK